MLPHSNHAGIPSLHSVTRYRLLQWQLIVLVTGCMQKATLPRIRLRYALLGLVVAVAFVVSSGDRALSQTNPATAQGYRLLERGWVNDAIAAFRQALERSPQSLEARLGLAIAYQRAGQDVNAWQTYQQVLAQDPRHRQALEAVGALGGYRPEWQARGIEALTTLLELAPQNTVARSQRALLLGYQGRFTESLADYEQLLANNPTPAVLLGAAQVSVYSGDYRRGKELFDRYRQTGGTLPDNALTDYARALQETGNAEQAIQLLDTRLRSLNRVDATTLQMRATLALAYHANGQSDRALTTLQPLENRPEATLTLARTWSTIARQSGNIALYERAVVLYQQVLQRTEQPSMGLMTEVADVLSESPSARREALTLYQRLVEQNPQQVSLIVKQQVVAQQVGQVSSEALRQELLSRLQPLPTAATEQRAIAQFLVRLDPPDPALLPVYQDLLNAGVDAPFLQYRIAQMQVQQGDLTAARRSLDAYTETAVGRQDLAPVLLYAELDWRSGNVENSISRYKALIDQNPPAPVLNSALQSLAGVYLMQERREEAIAIYDQLMARNPQVFAFRLAHAGLAYQAEQMPLSEAEAVLQQWLNSQPPVATPELFILVAALPPDPQRQGLYESLLAIAPTDLTIQRRYVQVLAMQDPELAQERLEQLIGRNPNDIGLYFLQGEIAQAMGDLERAAQTYEQLLARQPDNADALSALGGVRFEQQYFEVANRIFQRVLELRPNDLETRRVLAELSLARSYPLQALSRFRALQREQRAAGTSNSDIDRRVRQVQINWLRQRGMQPYWERY